MKTRTKLLEASLLVIIVILIAAFAPVANSAPQAEGGWENIAQADDRITTSTSQQEVRKLTDEEVWMIGGMVLCVLAGLFAFVIMTVRKYRSEQKGKEEVLEECRRNESDLGDEFHELLGELAINPLTRRGDNAIYLYRLAIQSGVPGDMAREAILSKAPDETKRVKMERALHLVELGQSLNVAIQRRQEQEERVKDHSW